MNGRKADGNGEPGATGASGNSHPNPRNMYRERYLVAARAAVALPGDTGAPAPGRLAELLEAEPGVRVLATIGGPDPGIGTWSPTGCPAVLAVEAPPAVAARLAATPWLAVEPDLPLAYTHPNPIASPYAAADPSVVAGPARDRIGIVVRGGHDEPVPGAAVYLAGGAWPVSGSTDENGRVSLPMPVDGTVTRLWIRPHAGHWPVVLDRPRLSAKEDNVISVQPLEATFEGFPKRQIVGWGAQALRIPEIAPTFRGHGVRIALIDSGAAVGHPDLAGRLAAGVDLLTGDERSWADDGVGHGTACAGIVTAADNEEGITGIAVDAEVHVLKAMPGGRVSHLLRALDHCIRHQVDVAQLSVGTLVGSELLALKIADARQAGVLCVAPAGNTGAGPVMFPANLPTVLSVGAIGRAGTFPTAPPTEFPGRLDLRSAQNPTPEIGPIGPDGLFVPGFTAGGPEVDVCAPGVAVVSTVPTDGYAVVDGTGVAAAHITAVAALVLAHHEDFRARYTRGPARVDRLAQLIISSCRPVGGYGTGAGLPDARFALAAGEHAYPGWADSLLGQLQVDLTRAGFIPSTPGWPPRTAPPR